MMAPMSPTPNLPTSRIRVIDRDNANAEIVAHLEGLVALGERPWCEVLYPPPIELDTDKAAAWDERQRTESFDAVELIDGELVTVPPYAELEAGI